MINIKNIALSDASISFIKNLQEEKNERLKLNVDELQDLLHFLTKVRVNQSDEMLTDDLYRKYMALLVEMIDLHKVLENNEPLKS